MKKLLLTLTIALFTISAFSTNSLLNDNNLLASKTVTSIVDEEIGNSCTYTVIITYWDGETYIEITHTWTGPCD